MAIATTPTLLSLDRFAKIVSLTPVHFNGADAGHFFPHSAECSDIWAQYAWQTPAQLVSREEIAYEIAKAEREIKEILGYSPAPDWEYREQKTWPQGGYLRDPKRFSLSYGKVIAPGVRGATLIKDGAEVIFSDEDGDTWNETATVTVTTDVTDKREVKLFFVDQDGEPEWEIRPLKKVVIDADAGTATITADSWLFIAPELWFEVPNDNGEGTDQPITIGNTENYVDVVDVYRIYNDVSAPGSNILVSQQNASVFCNYCGYGTCLNCGATTQAGTFNLLSGELPFVSPYPASYGDSGWVADPLVNCGVPRLVAFNYYAGEVDKRYAQGKSLDPLSDYWANIITWMAVARLPRGVCGCDNIRQRIDAMQTDLTKNSEFAGFSRTPRMDIYSSAFGTRVGEVQAWQAVTRIVGDQVTAGGAL